MSLLSVLFVCLCVLEWEEKEREGGRKRQGKGMQGGRRGKRKAERKEKKDLAGGGRNRKEGERRREGGDDRRCGH